MNIKEQNLTAIFILKSFNKCILAVKKVNDSLNQFYHIIKLVQFAKIMKP